MPQPNEIQESYKGFTINADKVKVNITKDEKVVYHRQSPHNQQCCAATNLQCGKAWIDGHR